MSWAQLTIQQGGVVARAQLRQIGMDSQRINYLLRSGRLAGTAYRGIYCAAGAPSTPHTVPWAVALRTGGVLSHMTAATLWDIETPTDGLVHVTVPDRRRTPSLPMARVHRCDLPTEAVTEHLGMPVTRRDVTVLDCLTALDFAPATRLLDRALQRRVVSLATVSSRLERYPGRWGNAQLTRLFNAAQSGTRAESERLMARLLRAAEFTGWRTNLPIQLNTGRFELDFAFPPLRLAIEVDGWAFHTDHRRFQADRRKQNALTAAGWITLRFTWWDLTETPEDVVDTIRAVIARRLLAS